MKTPELWRYIEEDGVSASFGLAADEYLVQAAGAVPTLRLYTYRSHAALVGRFQNTDAEVNVEECRRRGIAINRRPTGGGAIVMGADQLGVAMVGSTHGVPYSVCQAEIIKKCAAGLSAGLQRLGISSTFRPKNDVEVEGRKIAGLALALDERDTYLCHASLLVDFDVPLMLAVLNLPIEKISDKAISSFEERLTTVRHHCSQRTYAECSTWNIEGNTGQPARPLPVSIDDVRAQVRAGFAEVLGAQFETRPWTAAELEAMRELEACKYNTPEWVFERTPARDAVGMSLLKTTAGLLRVYAAVSADVLKSVLITGDFFATTRAVTELEAKLKWTRATRDHIAETVHGAFTQVTDLAAAVPEEILVEALCAAVDSAKCNVTHAS